MNFKKKKWHLLPLESSKSPYALAEAILSLEPSTLSLFENFIDCLTPIFCRCRCIKCVSCPHVLKIVLDFTRNGTYPSRSFPFAVNQMRAHFECPRDPWRDARRSHESFPYGHSVAHSRLKWFLSVSVFGQRNSAMSSETHLRTATEKHSQK